MNILMHVEYRMLKTIPHFGLKGLVPTWPNLLLDKGSELQKAFFVGRGSTHLDCYIKK